MLDREIEIGFLKEKIKMVTVPMLDKEIRNDKYMRKIIQYIKKDEDEQRLRLVLRTLERYERLQEKVRMLPEREQGIYYKNRMK